MQYIEIPNFIEITEDAIKDNNTEFQAQRDFDEYQLYLDQIN